MEKLLHCIDKHEGDGIRMLCGKMSVMPGPSVPYIDTRAAFLCFVEKECCPQCLNQAKIRSLLVY